MRRPPRTRGTPRCRPRQCAQPPRRARRVRSRRRILPPRVAADRARRRANDGVGERMSDARSTAASRDSSSSSSRRRSHGDVGHRRAPFGDGARLVEHDGGHGARALQRLAALDQQAGRAAAGRDHHRGRNRETIAHGQAITSGDRGRRRTRERRRRRHDHPRRERHDGEAQHDGHEHAADPVREALDRCARGLRVAHESDDARQRTVRAETLRAIAECARAIDGAAGDRIAGALSTGTLSPVSIDSSTALAPASTVPSTGRRSPGRTATTSPTTMSAIASSPSRPSRITRARLGCSSAARGRGAAPRALEQAAEHNEREDEERRLVVASARDRVPQASRARASPRPTTARPLRCRRRPACSCRPGGGGNDIYAREHASPRPAHQKKKKHSRTSRSQNGSTP